MQNQGKKRINLNGGQIIKKNKDYQNPQEAAIFYERKRLEELATVIFQDDWYHSEFKNTVISLMKFQNPIQMQVWHNNNLVGIVNPATGEKIIPTWHNLCSFERQCTIAEIYQAVEVLKRCTAIEVSDLYRKEYDNYLIEFGTASNNVDILKFFNNYAYPKIEAIVTHTQNILNDVEEQICKPIRDKINTDLKIMLQIPLTDTIEFVKKRNM